MIDPDDLRDAEIFDSMLSQEPDHYAERNDEVTC